MINVVRATRAVACLLTIPLSSVSASSVTIQNSIRHRRNAFLSRRPGRHPSVDVLTVGLRGGSHDGQQKRVDGRAKDSPQHAKETSRIISGLTWLGTAYGSSLHTHPIVTKSVTSGFMFGLSDWLAQCLLLSAKGGGMIDWPRIQMMALVGILYFGPAAHVWLNLLFRLFPGTSIGSTLMKSCIGQFVFGPSLVCVMFAASLVQQGTFSFSNYGNKIHRDLPGVWFSGLGFFPLANYVGYSKVPKDYMPLFQNCCSLLFNVYLSFITYRRGVAR